MKTEINITIIFDRNLHHSIYQPPRKIIKVYSIFTSQWKVISLKDDVGNTSLTRDNIFSANAGEWAAWNSVITNFVYPETSTPDYSNIMIPIVDNVRIDYIIACVAKQEKAVLLIGEQGVGKTVMMKSYMKKSNPEQHLSRSFNFSSATTPYQFQVKSRAIFFYEVFDESPDFNLSFDYRKLSKVM